MSEENNTEQQFYEALLKYADEVQLGEEPLPSMVAFIMQDGSIKLSQCDAIFLQLDILEESHFSDRLLIIVSVAYLEDQIRLLLKKFLIEHEVTNDLFNPNTNQLSSLLTMGKLAFSLGLLPKEWYEILKRMATLRNMFAHIPEARSFEELNKRENKAGGILDSLFNRYHELTGNALQGTPEDQELIKAGLKRPLTSHEKFSHIFREMFVFIQFAIDHVAGVKPIQAFKSDEIAGIKYFLGLDRVTLQAHLDGKFTSL